MDQIDVITVVSQSIEFIVISAVGHQGFPVVMVVAHVHSHLCWHNLPYADLSVPQNFCYFKYSTWLEFPQLVLPLSKSFVPFVKATGVYNPGEPY